MWSIAWSLVWSSVVYVIGQALGVGVCVLSALVCGHAYVQRVALCLPYALPMRVIV